MHFLDFFRAKIYFNLLRLAVWTLVTIVVGLEGPSLGKAHVLGLLIAQLGEVSLEGGEVEGGHKLVHQLRHQIDVSLVAAGRGVKQLYQGQGLHQLEFI